MQQIDKSLSVACQHVAAAEPNKISLTFACILRCRGLLPHAVGVQTIDIGGERWEGAGAGRGRGSGGERIWRRGGGEGGGQAPNLAAPIKGTNP